MQFGPNQRAKYLLFKGSCIKSLEIIQLWKRRFHILHESAICMREWKMSASIHLIWWRNFNKSFLGIPSGT